MRRATALLLATFAILAIVEARLEAGQPARPQVKAKPTGWRKLKGAPARVRAEWAKTSFRGSVGIRKGLVGVGGMGADLEVVRRSNVEAKALGARKWAGVLSVGPSTAIGTGRLHFSHDRKLIPKFGTWSYSIGPRSKRSPTQGDGIGVPTFNPFIGLTVSRKGGFGIKIAGWPTPVCCWPFVYGTLQFGVNHPGLEKASAVVLDRADRVEQWMARVSAPVRRPIAAAVGRVARPLVRVAKAIPDRLRKPQPTRGNARPRPYRKRVVADRKDVIGEGATSIVHGARDGVHVVKQMKPVIKGVQPITREGRIALAHRTVAGMDLLRDIGLPIPPAWIERGAPDAIVQEKVRTGLQLSELRGVAALRARANIVRLNVRAARELWLRRTFGWIDAGSSNVRFDARGNVVTWFDPVAPIKHRRFRLGPERAWLDRKRGRTERRPWGKDDL